MFRSSKNLSINCWPTVSLAFYLLKYVVSMNKIRIFNCYVMVFSKHHSTVGHTLSKVGEHCSHLSDTSFHVQLYDWPSISYCTFFQWMIQNFFAPHGPLPLESFVLFSVCSFTLFNHCLEMFFQRKILIYETIKLIILA